MSLTLKHGRQLDAVTDYTAEDIFGEIPMRAVNALRAIGVTTFGDLTKMTTAEVQAVSGIGEVAYQKIRRALEWRNLSLKTE